MNYENITIQDCIENFTMEGKTVVINDGQVLGFIKENLVDEN